MLRSGLSTWILFIRRVRFQRMNKINVLKPQLNTEPKVYYANLDGEVK